MANNPYDDPYSEYNNQEYSGYTSPPLNAYSSPYEDVYNNSYSSYLTPAYESVHPAYSSAYDPGHSLPTSGPHGRSLRSSGSGIPSTHQSQAYTYNVTGNVRLAHSYMGTDVESSSTANRNLSPRFDPTTTGGLPSTYFDNPHVLPSQSGSRRSHSSRSLSHRPMAASPYSSSPRSASIAASISQNESLLTSSTSISSTPLTSTLPYLTTASPSMASIYTSPSTDPFGGLSPPSASASASALTTLKSTTGPSGTASTPPHASPLSCLVPGCTYTSTRMYDVKRHMNSHNPTETFPCPYQWCGRDRRRPFTREDHLTEHLRKVHMRDIPKKEKGGGGGGSSLRRHSDDDEAGEDEDGEGGRGAGASGRIGGRGARRTGESSGSGGAGRKGSPRRGGSGAKGGSSKGKGKGRESGHGRRTRVEEHKTRRQTRRAALNARKSDSQRKAEEGV